VSTPQKRQGTAWESALVKAVKAAGLDAYRLALAGIHDRNDVKVDAGTPHYIEAKNTSTLSIHETLVGARAKTPGAVTWVVWKRLRKVPGKKVRRAVGVPVAATTVEDMAYLMACEKRLAELDAGFLRTHNPHHPYQPPTPLEGANPE
jgi:hypothetical protein